MGVREGSLLKPGRRRRAKGALRDPSDGSDALDGRFAGSLLSGGDRSCNCERPLSVWDGQGVLTPPPSAVQEEESRVARGAGAGEPTG